MIRFESARAPKTTKIFHRRWPTVFVSIFLLIVCAPTDAQTIDDTAIVDTSLTRFDYQCKKVRIYPIVQNALYPKSPERWTFEYEPLLVPVIRPDSESALLRARLKETSPGAAKQKQSLSSEARMATLILSVPYRLRIDSISPKIMGDGSRIPQYRVSLPILVSNKESDDAALARLKHVFTDTALDSGNVDTIKISSLAIVAPDIGDNGLQIRQARLAFSDVNNPSGSFDITIDVTGDENLEHLVSQLHTFRFNSTYSLAVRASSSEVVALTADKIIDTTLYKKLNGIAPDTNGNVYVRRNDLSALSVGASTEIQGFIVTQSANSFARTLVENLVNNFGQVQTVEESAFDSEMWKHTYDGRDLRPDELTKTINKRDEKSADKSHDVYAGSTGGGVDILDIVKANGNLSGSSDTYKESLREAGVYAEFEGSKWVPKSIDLVALNMAQFRQSKSVLVNSMSLGPTSTKNDLRTQIPLSFDCATAQKASASPSTDPVPVANP